MTELTRGGSLLVGCTIQIIRCMTELIFSGTTQTVCLATKTISMTETTFFVMTKTVSKAAKTFCLATETIFAATPTFFVATKTVCVAEATFFAVKITMDASSVLDRCLIPFRQMPCFLTISAHADRRPIAGKTG
jgi:hypothetical protein